MLRRTVFAVIICWTAVSGRADYITDRQAAIALMRTGKTEEALAAFLKMADGPVTPFQKSDALGQAVLCALNLKKDDLALELAGKIPLAPFARTSEMRVLSSTRKWQVLVDKFKDDDIARWPDCVIADASQLRGNAFLALKNGTCAEADYRRAADYAVTSNDRGLFLNHLGDTYRDLIKDDGRAIETYRKVYQTDNVYKRCHAAVAVAGILQRQGKADEALQELTRIKLEDLTIPLWRGTMLDALAEALVNVGRRPDAAARYREALQIEGISEATKTRWQNALKELEASTAPAAEGR